MNRADHAVVFFDQDSTFLDVLARFAGEGLDAGQRVIVIASPQHIAALVNALGSADRGRERQNHLVLIYAADGLRRIVRNGSLDRDALLEWLGPLVAEGPCRIAGEMVSLLAERGQLDVAFDLEAAGHELAHAAGVPILCGYDLRHLDAAQSGGARERIAACHDSVVAPLATAPAPAPRRPRVLLAEDFTDAREMYAEYLQYADVEVVTACDGEEAVRLARAQMPDLVLMDIRMPRLTGTQAMRLLREEERFRRIPFVALTAHALENERAEILAAGFDGVIVKPCLPDQLVAEVRTRLAGLLT